MTASGWSGPDCRPVTPANSPCDSRSSETSVSDIWYTGSDSLSGLLFFYFHLFLLFLLEHLPVWPGLTPVQLGWFTPQRPAVVIHRGRLKVCLLPGGRRPPSPDYVGHWGMGMTCGDVWAGSDPSAPKLLGQPRSPLYGSLLWSQIT